jgi:hypothetical protein
MSIYIYRRSTRFTQSQSQGTALALRLRGRLSGSGEKLYSNGFWWDGIEGKTEQKGRSHCQTIPPIV